MFEAKSRSGSSSPRLEVEGGGGRAKSGPSLEERGEEVEEGGEEDEEVQDEDAAE